MAVSNAYLAQYLTEDEIARFTVRASNAPRQNGRCLIMDYPIAGVDKFIAQTCARINFSNYGPFTMCVANESGAIVGALLAAGYTPLEIIEIRSSGALDPIALIEGGQKMPDALHIRKKGADHKGLRLRDTLDKIIRDKIGGDPNVLVTFDVLRSAGKRMPLFITVLDVTSGGVMALGSENHPSMPVADAVLASCAVQPYIGGVAFTDGDGTHTFMACCNYSTLPISQAATLFKQRGMTGNFAALAVGFGSITTANDAASGRKVSGTELYKQLLSTRIPANVPDAMRRNFMMF